MAKKQTFKIEGFKELEQQLLQLHKRSTAKSVMRKSLKEAASPFLATAKEHVPKDEHDLDKSLTITTRLSQKANKSAKREGKSSVEVYVGSSSSIAHLQEFGTEHQSPQPYMRPAWEKNKGDAVENVRKSLEKNVMAALKRQRKRDGWEQ